MTNLRKALPGGRVLLEDTSLSFYQGAKIGVIGPNGAGKSSLLKIIAQVDREFEGKLWVSDKVKVGYLPQEPRLNPGKTVFENIVEGIGPRWEMLRRFDEICAALEKGEYEHLGGDAVFEEQVALTEKIETTNAWNIKADVQTAMAALRCPRADAAVTDLSGGEARRVALCRLLLSEPDALLLDEPTNHLDAWSVSWIESYLAKYKGTVLAITHDRYFLDNIADWILEIDSGWVFVGWVGREDGGCRRARVFC
jgi:sulfate-transporting ATPase